MSTHPAEIHLHWPDGREDTYSIIEDSRHRWLCIHCSHIWLGDKIPSVPPPPPPRDMTELVEWWPK